MFERFKKSRGTPSGATSVATREREARADAPMDGTTTRDTDMDMADDRGESPRFERESPGERDRGVVAGGGAADLAGDRAFERDDMARGTSADGDTALGRDRARDDLGRDDLDRDRLDRDEMGRRDDDVVARDHDGEHERDRGVSPGAPAGGAAAAAAAGAAVEHHHDRKVEREEGFDRDRNREIAEGRTLDRDRDRADDRTRAADRTVADDRVVTRDRDLDRDGVDDRVERHGPVLAPAALDT